MEKRKKLIFLWLVLAMAALASGLDPGWAAPVTQPGMTPDYFETPNWANSPPLTKFVDTLPGLGAAGANNLGQYIPVAEKEPAGQQTYPGSDYYEIAVVEFSERMHSELNPTRLRGYVQLSTAKVPGRQIPLTYPDGSSILINGVPRPFLGNHPPQRLCRRGRGLPADRRAGTGPDHARDHPH